MPVALPPEVRHEDRRHEKLHQRAAEEADELSEHTEQGMPELVDREVEAVEPAVVAGVENQEPAVHREHGGEGEARASLRYGTTRLERKLPLMITFPPPAGRISKMPLSESPRTLPVVVVTTTAVTMRHGVPVSDALRNDRPSQVPAYLCAGPADVAARDPSPGAHAARTRAVQSSVRMCRLRYVSRMEYERSDRPTQGSAEEPAHHCPCIRVVSPR